jgi:glutathione S-transferase
MLRLYQREGAGRPLRVRWALEEAGADYEAVVMTREEGKGEEHARRHPLGRVPVLETDEGLLFESAALCLHVADLHPQAQLIPPVGTQERGEVYQWAFFAMAELEPVLIRAFVARRDEDEALERLLGALARAGEAVVAGLGEGEYLVGGRFTVADVVVGGVLESARRFDLLPGSPPLRAYLERLEARPAMQRAYAD